MSVLFCCQTFLKYDSSPMKYWFCVFLLSLCRLRTTIRSLCSFTGRSNLVDQMNGKWSLKGCQCLLNGSSLKRSETLSVHTHTHIHTKLLSLSSHSLKWGRHTVWATVTLRSKDGGQCHQTQQRDSWLLLFPGMTQKIQCNRHELCVKMYFFHLYLNIYTVCLSAFSISLSPHCKKMKISCIQMENNNIWVTLVMQNIKGKSNTAENVTEDLCACLCCIKCVNTPHHLILQTGVGKTMEIKLWSSFPSLSLMHYGIHSSKGWLFSF